MSKLLEAGCCTDTPNNTVGALVLVIVIIGALIVLGLAFSSLFGHKH